MSGQPAVGINKYTKENTPISKVADTELKCNCICHICEIPLEAAIEEEKDEIIKVNCITALQEKNLFAYIV